MHSGYSTSNISSHRKSPYVIRFYIETVLNCTSYLLLFGPHFLEIFADSTAIFVHDLTTEVSDDKI